MWAANTTPEPYIFGSHGRFRPNDPITREEMIVILRRVARETHNTNPGALNRFPDRLQVNNDFIPAMQWAAHRGIIGADGRLNPRGNATRSEALVMIRRTSNLFDWTLFNSWEPPVSNVPPLLTRLHNIDKMTSNIQPVTDELKTGVIISNHFTVTNPGMHRFVLTELAHFQGTIQIQIYRGTEGGPYESVLSWTPLRHREGRGLMLTASGYRVDIQPTSGTAGQFELSILEQKGTHNITPADQRYRIITVTDYIEFIGQQNRYRFETPATRTGLQPASGMYRFDISSLATAPHVRATVNLEVRLERGNQLVHGPTPLAWGEGVNVRLDDNETYFIIVSHVNISNGVGTVISNQNPYTLRIGAQKGPSEISPMRNNNDERHLRVSLVNDEFQFIGQQNTYEITAPSTGLFQFRPNLLPGQSHVLMQVSNPWGGVQERIVGVRDGISVHLIEGAFYRLHITHLAGNPLGAYSFTIVYP